MKKIIIIAMLCITPVLIAMGGKPKVGSVGILDNQVVFTEAKIVEGINEKFTELESAATKEVELLQERIDALKLTKAEKELVEQVQLQSSIFQLQTTLEDYQNAIITEVEASLEKAIAQVRDSRKMTVIVGKESVLSYDANVDITNEVILALDAMLIELPPLPDLTLPEPTKP